jgi:hypothetical protein
VLVTLVLLMTAMLIVTMGPALAVGRALPQDGHTPPHGGVRVAGCSLAAHWVKQRDVLGLPSGFCDRLLRYFRGPGS